ncbi:MAG: EAL domain-containing protein [Erysipelotrichaceae bacterium]
MMKYQALPKNSIVYKILVPTIIVLLLQAIIFFSAIIFGGVFDQLQQNRMDVLNEQVINRKNYLENEMKDQWSNIDNYEEIFANKIKPYAKYQRKDAMLEACHNDLIQMLRISETNGAFLILNPDENETEVSALYISDSDPRTPIGDNEDLLYQVAPNSLVKEYGIGMGQFWQAKFPKEIVNYNFYEKTIHAAMDYPTLPASDLGYWSKPFELIPQTGETMTYSIPIIDEDGTIYGLYGIAIKCDYLEGFLPFHELVDDNSGSYYLEMKENQHYRKVVANGITYDQYVKNGKELEFNENVYSDIYKIETNHKTSNQVYASSKRVDLYNKNSPFVKETWSLIAMATMDSLFAFSAKIIKLLGFTLVISCLLAVIALLIVAKRISKPIVKLVKQVNQSKPDQELQLQKTNFDEIDNLAASITHLSISVAKSASRFSQIIDLSGEAIGAYEFVEGDRRVYCTNKFFTILEYPQKDGNYLDIAIFEEIMDKASRHQVIDQEDVFCIQIKSYRKKWIKIRKGRDGKRFYGVLLDVSDEMKERSKLLYERDHDILTGLMNRRAFITTMKDLLKSEDLKIGALLMWDLDNLKYVNDTYGHDYGDLYLEHAGKSLALFKKDKGIVARMSGDEFFVFLYGFDSKEEIIQLIDRQYKVINDTSIHLPGGDNFKVKVSMGLSWYPQDADNYDELSRYSDFAMYKAKNTIKGHYTQFDKEAYEKESYLFEGVEVLNHLLKDECITYMVQPIIDMKNGSIFGYEALMRSSIDYFKSPMEIIKIAKTQSKLYQLELLTWKKALSLFQSILMADSTSKLFINSVPNYILSRNDIAVIVEGKEAYLNRVVMEITENDEISEEAMTTKIAMMKDWRGQMAMDDYGSGHNGELALLTYPLQFVKIDMTLIRGLDCDLGRQKLVSNIISYCHSQNIKVIGEGVETKEEFIKLLELGIDYGQGFYIGRPSYEVATIDSEIKGIIKGTINQ